MNKLPCRRVLYSYETRILFLLLSRDRAETAREIGRSLRETDLAIDGVFAAPAAHGLGCEFFHSLHPESGPEADEIVDVDLNTEQVAGLLRANACHERCEECQELLQLIPDSIRHDSGCHTYALATGSGVRDNGVADSMDNSSHVVEYIIDQRSGQGRLHWLM